MNIKIDTSQQSGVTDLRTQERGLRFQNRTRCDGCWTTRGRNTKSDTYENNALAFQSTLSVIFALFYHNFPKVHYLSCLVHPTTSMSQSILWELPHPIRTLSQSILWELPHILSASRALFYCTLPAIITSYIPCPHNVLSHIIPLLLRFNTDVHVCRGYNHTIIK